MDKKTTARDTAIESRRTITDAYIGEYCSSMSKKNPHRGNVAMGVALACALTQPLGVAPLQSP